jgi:hypothetical protein
MIADLHQLVGFRLEACRFTICSYSFELDGMVNERHESLLIGTSYFLSLGSSPRTDLRENVSREVWPFLEQSVTAVSVVDESPEVVFRFSKGELVVWAPPRPEDNLLVVRSRLGSEWCGFL